MKIGAIIQARMGSSRLPGKVLRTIAGKPLLQFVLERVQRCQTIDAIIVATSREPQDTPIVTFCREHHVEVFRGSLDNVASRFAQVVEHYALDAFVRVCADSPLIDPELIDRMVGVFQWSHCNVVTNVCPRTFPVGESVEVVDAACFRRACAEMTAPDHFEHVTRYCYEHPARFTIRTVRAARDYSHIRLAVDTEEDLEHLRELIDGFEHPHWHYDLAAILRHQAAAAAPPSLLPV